MDVKSNRIKLGLTQAKLSEMTGIPRDRIAAWERKLGNPKATDTAILEKVFSEFVPSESVKEPLNEYVINKKVRTGKTPVKFYDIDFLAGSSPIQFYDDTNMIEVSYEMNIPEFSGCTAFRAYSDSMEPLVKSGSILFGTKIEDWITHLEYGQIYGIVCNDGRRYLKYIRRHKESDKLFILRSENSEMYDDFEIPKKEIKNLWLINGWLNKRT